MGQPPVVCLKFLMSPGLLEDGLNLPGFRVACPRTKAGATSDLDLRSGVMPTGPELAAKRITNSNFGMTPFFRPITYESRLAASIGWQEDYNYDEQKKKTALPGANSSQNSGS